MHFAFSLGFSEGPVVSAPMWQARPRWSLLQRGRSSCMVQDLDASDEQGAAAMRKARKLYESPTGDRWYLIRDHPGRCSSAMRRMWPLAAASLTSRSERFSAAVKVRSSRSWCA